VGKVGGDPPVAGEEGVGIGPPVAGVPPGEELPGLSWEAGVVWLKAVRPEARIATMATNTFSIFI
jgi:hypothetical protein